MERKVILDKENFTEQAMKALLHSRKLAQAYRHQQTDLEHLALALLTIDNSSAARMLTKVSVDVNELVVGLESHLSKLPKSSAVGKLELLQETPRLQQALIKAYTEAQRLKDELISIDHLLLGITGSTDGAAAQLFREHGINTELVYKAIEAVRGSTRVTDSRAESKYGSLEKYGEDLTAKARAGELDPVIGRDTEINRVMQVLTRRTKNNPVIVGDAGVGKTALVEGLAQRIVTNNVPETLKNKRVISLQLSTLVAGTSLRGEFEERLQAVLNEIKQARGEIVLFIDEIHTVVGAGSVGGGSLDASNIMKPALAKGELQTVGATTPAEYRKYIEADAALERRFSPVWVEEPAPDIAIKMLETLRPRYEKHHALTITDKAIEAAVKLSTRYITDRFLPDKAIDLIDEASAKLRIKSESMPPELHELQQKRDMLEDEINAAHEKGEYEGAAIKKTELEKMNPEYEKLLTDWRSKEQISSEINADDIAAIIAERTGINVERLLEGEAERLINLEERLHRRVIGQDEAITAVSNAIRRARAGLQDPNRPIGSFLFVGPTGVGKTELARALAEFLFDHQDNMIRVDMSEFQASHSVSRLIGAPPGYVGYDDAGQLTEQVRRRPFSVVLFDEVEKAHPEIWDVLLQVLDDGRLTDGHGRVVNFKNTIIIMTSNAGSELINKNDLGFRSEDSEDKLARLRQVYEDALKERFRPEFLNRLDETIVFDTLSKEQVITIVDKLLLELEARLQEQKLTIELTPVAKEFVAEQGYDPEYGVRPLKRLIQRTIENPISELVIGRGVSEGDTIKTDCVDDELELSVVHP